MTDSGKAKMTYDEAVHYLSKLNTRKQKRLAIYQKDFDAKKLKAQDAALYMDVFQKHTLDSLFFEKGVEDDDLLEAALFYKFSKKPQFFEVQPLQVKEGLEVKEEEGTGTGTSDDNEEKALEVKL